MTPLLLAMGIYCTIVALAGTKLKSDDLDRANFLDKVFFIHFAGAIYFWVKVSDLILGWSA